MILLEITTIWPQTMPDREDTERLGRARLPDVNLN
jgi:hypothetical protein